MKADTPTTTAAAPVLAMRPKEAAQALGISARKLWAMTAAGEVPCVRLGRAVTYPVATLQQWLADRATGGEVVRR